MADFTEAPPGSRRGFIKGLAGLGLLGGAGLTGAAARRDLVVVTSYPDEVVSRFEAAFEKGHPHWRLRIVWRMPHDAMTYLRHPAAEGVDVYWSPAPRNFAQLKREGRLRRAEIDRDGLPGRIGNTAIDDRDGDYLATETAGYGFAVSPAALAARGLAAPADWRDLAAPEYAGAIALPDPARVGFAPVMVDIPLQAYGWERGWATWSAIVANSSMVERGGLSVIEELGPDRRAVALSIDFFVAQAISKGASLRFIYPRHGGVNPGQVAMLAVGRNPEGARAFIAFLLSPAGQKLLAHPDVRKLPVRPSVYAELPAGYHDPFAAAAAGGYGYASERGQGRLALIAALFHTVLVESRPALARCWSRARAIGGEAGARAIRLLERVPASEAEADRPDWQRAFAERGDDAAAAVLAAELEERWRRAGAQALAEAERILEGGA